MTREYAVAVPPDTPEEAIMAGPSAVYIAERLAELIETGGHLTAERLAESMQRLIDTGVIEVGHEAHHAVHEQMNAAGRTAVEERLTQRAREA